MGNLHLVSLSKLRLLPENVIIRLLITRTNRTTNSVTWCPKLAPSPELFRTYLTKWRSGQVPNWWDLYTKRFLDEMQKEPMQGALTTLRALLKRSDVAIVCFCNTRQCHRYLIGDYFKNMGINVIIHE